MKSGRPVIFICYRRLDAPGYAGRIHDRLLDMFGSPNVFMDHEVIQPGQNFEAAIAAALEETDAMLVVIGPSWSSRFQPVSTAAAADPPENDYVIYEIAQALQRGVPIIPVLVGGASMPAAKTLPAEMQTLAKLQAVELSDGRWAHDVGRLTSAVWAVTAGTQADPAAAPESETDPVVRHWRWFAAAGSAGVLWYSAGQLAPVLWDRASSDQAERLSALAIAAVTWIALCGAFRLIFRGYRPGVRWRPLVLWGLLAATLTWAITEEAAGSDTGQIAWLICAGWTLPLLRLFRGSFTSGKHKTHKPSRPDSQRVLLLMGAWVLSSLPPVKSLLSAISFGLWLDVLAIATFVVTWQLYSASRSALRARQISLRWLMAASVALLFASWSGAAGTVVDSTGGVIPGATVKVTGPSLIGVSTFETVTDSHGRFRRPLWISLPWRHTLTVELPGFTSIRRGVLYVPPLRTSSFLTIDVAAVETTLTTSATSLPWPFSLSVVNE